MKHCISTIFLLALSLLGARVASACSCSTIGTPQKNLAEVDAVFLGKVTKAKKHEWQITVTRAWKGQLQDLVMMRDPAAGTSCESQFKLGESYIFFARTKQSGGKSIYLPTACTWTVSLTLRHDGYLVSEYVLRELGEGWSPSPSRPQKKPRPNS